MSKIRTELPCLPLIQERFWNEVKDKEEYTKVKYLQEFEFYMFPQAWGSTSLGFGGIGGQAMTSAYTTVITDNCADGAEYSLEKDWHIRF